MLRFLRDSSQSFLIYLMFGILVFVFAVSFGPGSGSCGPTGQDYAVVVNGDVVRRQEYALRFNNQMDYMRRLGMADSMNSDVMRNQIRRQVIDQMIEARLLIQEAKRLGMRVTDDELIEYLETNHNIKDLDYKEFEERITQGYGMTVARFEEQTREDILASRMNRFLRDMIDIGDEELKETFLRERDRARVALVRFSPTDIKAEAVTAPDEAAIKKVLDEEPEAVKKAYDDNIFKYRTGKEVRARQILRKLPRDASDDDVAKAKAELLELKTQVDGGADFAELAKAHSEDEATKANGGDMGFVKQGLMAKALVDALFALQANEITAEPVRTPQGLHLMQVTEIKPPSRQELADVQNDVARNLLLDRRRQAASRAEAEAFLEKLKSGAALEELTRSGTEEPTDDTTGKPARLEPGWILASQKNIPGVGEAPELHAAIFAATTDKPVLEQVFPVARGFYVAKLIEREKPDLTKFEEAKEELRNNALWGKRNEVYRAWVKNLRDNADIQVHPDIAPADDSALPFPPAG